MNTCKILFRSMMISQNHKLMGGESEKKKKYSAQELSEILSRLEKRGFVKSGEAYFEALKEEILKREQDEIEKLKKELQKLSEKKFKNRDEFLGFLEKLFPNLPQHPSAF